MADRDAAKHRIGTRLVEAGRRRQWTKVPDLPGGVVNPPIWRASTHLYENCAALKEAAAGSNEDGRFFYGRRGAPTQWALADALTGLEEGAFGTMLYPSGVAAITGSYLAVLKPGDRLLISGRVMPLEGNNCRFTAILMNACPPSKDARPVPARIVNRSSSSLRRHSTRTTNAQ